MLLTFPDLLLAESGKPAIEDEPSGPISPDLSQLNVISPGQVKTESIQVDSGGWQTLLSEGFETPAALWMVAGNPTWAVSDYTTHTGNNSAYCAGGGSLGVNPASGGAYINNMNAILVIGPFDLSDASAADITYWRWVKTQPNDTVGVYLSVDGRASFWGWSTSGQNTTWNNVTHDLTNWPGLGNVCSQSSVYLAMIFKSNATDTDTGAFIDDIILRKYLNLPLTVVTDPASGVSATSATLNGRLTGLGGSNGVQVSFEYGLTTEYGNTTSFQTLTGEGLFSASLTDLSAITTYHFRSKAAGDITAYGSDMTFTTDSETVSSAVWSWGRNNAGQLGNGSLTNSSVPAAVNGLTDVVAVAAGSEHSLALKSNGAVWAWGQNYYGQLGNNSIINSPIPVPVSGLSSVVAISAGGSHSLALKSDGTVWSWGFNGYHQLGTGVNGDSHVPVQVSGLSGVASISGGDIVSLALKSDGTVWGWGSNFNGQLGSSLPITGTAATTNVPIILSELSGITEISAGYYHCLALTAGGQIMSWGGNSFAQLGNGTTVGSTFPVQVNDLSGVKHVAAGFQHSLAIKSDGTAWGWGRNWLGELGSGDYRSSPVQISGLVSVIGLDGGYEHSLVVISDGLVKVWGNGASGQIGDNTTVSKIIPTYVVNLTGVRAVSAGASFNLALKGGLNLLDSPLPSGQVGSAYSTAFSVAGGTVPYSWSIIAGSLPAGLILGPGACNISGTPIAPGTFNFTAQVTDNAGNVGIKPFSITIYEANLDKTTVSISVGLQGTSRPDAGWAIPLNVKFFTPGTGSPVDVLTATPIYSLNLTTAKNGNTATVQANEIFTGIYDITVASPHTLINVKRKVTISGNSTSVDMGSLLEGNANDDDRVNINDFGLLAKTYGKQRGQNGFDERADFDRNEKIHITDFGLLAANYGKYSPIEAP